MIVIIFFFITLLYLNSDSLPKKNITEHYFAGSYNFDSP